uniref:Chalcone-flavonone isomerase family protein n=2 Tax=Carthamus tinctorius TaxID=4222 RepID=A0A1L1ZLV4_CARTI|nr:chalcone isomerase [Carthamus tinctorius]AWD93840.1 Chalcone-flavanone isomerase [Carthamus tinctorius]
MAPPPSTTTSLQVESVVFPPSVKAPGTATTLFLAGAGVRGMEIEGKFVKLTGIGLYLEDKAIPSLAVKWKGKTAAELMDSVHFYSDIINGPFEKLAEVAMIVPLVGMQHAETLSKMCVAIWKAEGTYTDADSATIAKYLEAFKDQKFSPGSSILYTTTPDGLVMVSFVKDGIIPETPIVVLENKKLGHALFESVIGKNGVSPEAKQSLASRLADLMN